MCGLNNVKYSIKINKGLRNFIIIDNNIQECPNLNLSKPIGVYKFSTSGIKNTKYGTGLQKKFEGYDD